MGGVGDAVKRGARPIAERNPMGEKCPRAVTRYGNTGFPSADFDCDEDDARSVPASGQAAALLSSA